MTQTNINLKTIKNFDLQRNAIDEDSKKKAPEVPKLNMNTAVAKWDDSFKVHVRKRLVHGKATCPGTYNSQAG